VADAGNPSAGTGRPAGAGEPAEIRLPGARADLSAALDMETAGRVVGRLFALAPRLVEILDLGAREYGMSYARGRVVAALQASGPVLMRALSQDVGVTPRTITGLVDALEADGWVERRAHPTDRRATIVALTPAAEAAFARLIEGYRGLAQDLVSGIPEADQQCALGVLGHISARLDDAVRRGTAAFDPPTSPADQRKKPGSSRVAEIRD
jgi:DNA-binding MarR family transcriptional regulator